MRCVFTLYAALVVAAVFTSCKKDGKKVTAKYQFSGNVPAQRAAVKSSSAGAVEGTEEYEKFYSMLGAKKGSITPTMLELAVGGSFIYTADGSEHFEELLDFGVVDLAKPIVINAGEIKSGEYKLFQFSFSLFSLHTIIGGKSATSRVSFPKPAGFNYSTHVYNTRLNEVTNIGNVAEDGNNITAELGILDPAFINNTRLFSDNTLGYEINAIGNILMGGDTYKVINTTGALGNLTFNDIIPGTPRISIGGGFSAFILAPFEGINVPEDANAVRFEIYWNIDNIIEQYEGETDSPDDDIFVLKNGFWNEFSIQAFIE